MLLISTEHIETCWKPRGPTERWSFGFRQVAIQRTALSRYTWKPPSWPRAGDGATTGPSRTFGMGWSQMSWWFFVTLWHEQIRYKNPGGRDCCTLFFFATNLKGRVWIGWIDFQVCPGNLSWTVCCFWPLFWICLNCSMEPCKIERNWTNPYESPAFTPVHFWYF